MKALMGLRYPVTLGMAMILVCVAGCCRHPGTHLDHVLNPGRGSPEPPDIRVHGDRDGEHLNRIYFDYDEARLTAGAIEALRKNARFIKDNGDGARVQISGHCDERGTQEYNLALGQRRAEVVRDYLVSLGLPASQFVTVSYGEEDPLTSEHNEEAWAKNRRVEFCEAR